MRTQSRSRYDIIYTYYAKVIDIVEIADVVNELPVLQSPR